MATFSVTHHQRLDDVAVVQTLETTDITVGQTITLTGLGHGLNGTYIVIAVPVNLFAGVNEAGDLLFNEKRNHCQSVNVPRCWRRSRTICRRSVWNFDLDFELYLVVINCTSY